MFEYLVNKPNYCHTSTFVYKTLESKIAIRKGRVRFKGSLPALDSAGLGESGRADSSKDTSPNAEKAQMLQILNEH